MQNHSWSKQNARTFVLVQNERDKYRTASRISNRLLVSLVAYAFTCSVAYA